MIIVGGTYRERVTVPDSDDLAGSGMRAAAALKHAASRPLLYTAVDDKTSEEADLVAQAMGVERTVVRRSEAVGFRYFSPISAPAVNGPNASLRDDIAVDGRGSTVLMFGLVETGTVTVEADTVVLDPQKPRDGGPLSLDHINAGQVILVANRAEVRQLGGVLDERTAVEGLLQHPLVDAVVTKRAAAGCTVSRLVDGTPRHTDVGAHPTFRVWPIGSGDVFSAGFAHAVDSGADAESAAGVASAAAAHWCSTRVPELPVGLLKGSTDGLPPPLAPSRPLLYLAGPFFSLQQRWLVEEVRETLFSLGVRVFSPFHDVGVGGPSVAAADLAGLSKCDAVLALLDGVDLGTVFEVGWAVREGIPVVGYASVLDAEVAKMMSGTSVELHRDVSTACYRAAWAGMGLRTVAGWAE
jgi:nucleoside 2-deoxyribosyltransferase